MKTSARILFNAVPVVGLTIVVTIVVLFTSDALFAAEDTTAGETGSRISETRHFLGGRGDAAVSLGVSRDEYRSTGDTAIRKGVRENVSRKPRNTTPSAAPAPNDEFWFYSVDVELFHDTDRDGYFAGIDLLFDADTLYAAADVYAVVYLSLDGGDWVEYATTEDFTIFGTSDGDSYNIVTDLIDGYPTGSYDLLIELFDAWNGEFVAYAGPENASALALLPLEDRNNDAPVDGGSIVVVNSGGGGATGLLALVVLAGATLVRRRRQRQPAALSRAPGADFRRAVLTSLRPQAARLSK